MKSKLKKYIPLFILITYRFFRVFIVRSLQIVKGYFKHSELYFHNFEKTVYLLGTPEHDNLGDHAITIASHSLIGKYLKDYKVIEITIESFYEHYLLLKKHIKSEDIIIFNGGGNFSDHYLEDEKIRRKIIENFLHNKIMLLPQTFYFSDTRRGKLELNKTKKIYNNHPNLILVAREELSYLKMIESFPNARILLAPDVVFSMNKTNSSINRKGVSLVLRSDKEGVLSLDDKNNIKNILEKKFGSINEFDTCLSKGVSINDRKTVLENLFLTFQSSELVITDRLHGLIISVITSTPCIVFSNFNHKIIYSHKWIESYKSVYLLYDISQIEIILDNFKSDKLELYNAKEFDVFFENIFSVLKG